MPFLPFNCKIKIRRRTLTFLSLFSHRSLSLWDIVPTRTSLNHSRVDRGNTFRERAGARRRGPTERPRALTAHRRLTERAEAERPPRPTRRRRRRRDAPSSWRRPAGLPPKWSPLPATPPPRFLPKEPILRCILKAASLYQLQYTLGVKRDSASAWRLLQ